MGTKSSGLIGDRPAVFPLIVRTNVGLPEIPDAGVIARRSSGELGEYMRCRDGPRSELPKMGVVRPKSSACVATNSGLAVCCEVGVADRFKRCVRTVRDTVRFGRCTAWAAKPCSATCPSCSGYEPCGFSFWPHLRSCHGSTGLGGALSSTGAGGGGCCAGTCMMSSWKSLGGFEYSACGGAARGWGLDFLGSFLSAGGNSWRAGREAMATAGAPPGRLVSKAKRRKEKTEMKAGLKVL